MADYQDIRGLRVKYLSADPANPEGGQVWYNSTTGTLRSRLLTTAWSSSAPLSTTREGAAGFGLQTAAVICGGETPPVSNATEEYNGSGWTAGGNLNTARFRHGGVGTLTAGLIFGGFVPPHSSATETYNGTAWTTSPYTLNTARSSLAGGGTQTSALAFGGAPGYKTSSEEFDGEGWTSTPSLNTGRESIMGAGTNAEACLAFGGYTSSPPTVAVNNTESWDGTSWTEVNNLNTARYGGYGAGTQSAAFLAGGIVGPGTMQSATETWDGTDWTTSPASLATARGRLTTAGTTTAALAASGQTPSLTTATEEYNQSTSAITAGAWASGNNMNQTRRGIASASAGTQTAALGAMGYTSPPGGVGRSDAETYDGSTWSAITAMPVTRYFGGGFGTQTAAVIVGGYSTVPTASQKNETYEWNGSSWSQTGNQAAGISNFAVPGVGIESAGMIAGGMPSPTNWQLTQEYDGSVWASSPGSLNTGRTGGGGAGTQTAAIATAGDVGGPTPVSLASEEYNGSTWTSTANSLYDMYGVASAGTTTAALMACQDTLPPYEANAQNWDGSAWSTSPSFNTARQQMGGAGTAIAAVAFSGNVMPGSTTTSAATEEFTGPTSAANIETLTTS